MIENSEKEAEALCRHSKKVTTTSLIKWHVSQHDWDKAASGYEKAANIYRVLNMTEKAKNTWILASDAHRKAGNWYFGAVAMERCADVLKLASESNREKEKKYAGNKDLIDAYVQAAELFAAADKPERQAQIMRELASCISSNGDAPRASSILLKAIEVLEKKGKDHYTVDIYRTLVLVQVRSKLYMDAITSLRKEAKMFERLGRKEAAAKTGLESLILALATEDVVFARQLFMDLSKNLYGFQHTSEQGIAFVLLQAIYERDENALKWGLKDSTLQFIIPDIARLAKRLSVPDLMKIGSSIPSQRPEQNAAREIGEGGRVSGDENVNDGIESSPPLREIEEAFSQITVKGTQGKNIKIWKGGNILIKEPLDEDDLK